MDPMTLGLIVAGGLAIRAARKEDPARPEVISKPLTTQERGAAALQGMAVGTITGTIGGGIIGGTVGGLLGPIGAAGGAYYGAVTGGAAASTVGFFVGATTGKSPFGKK